MILLKFKMMKFLNIRQLIFTANLIIPKALVNAFLPFKVPSLRNMKRKLREDITFICTSPSRACGTFLLIKSSVVTVQGSSGLEGLCVRMQR
jgi:hypothetical protein